MGSWAGNKDILVLIYSREEDEFTKLYFETTEVKAIIFLLECYSRIEAGETTTEAVKQAIDCLLKIE